MKHIAVEDCMTRNVITVDPNTTLFDAYQLMREHRIRRLPVVDEAGYLVGIITRGDIRAAWPTAVTSLFQDLQGLLFNQPVSLVMTRSPIAISPDACVEEAARLMLERKIGGLPVVDAGRVVGVLTDSDLFRLIIKGEFVPA